MADAIGLPSHASGLGVQADSNRLEPSQLHHGQPNLPCRHGARTPLTDRYWEGATWQAGPDCGQQYEAVRIAISDLRGGPQPPASHDAK